MALGAKDTGKETELDSKALKAAARFFSENEQAIADYAQQRGLYFVMGDHWSINMETGRGTFDPIFFLSRGYTFAESMWATCHEIEHFLDWRRDPEAYRRLFMKISRHRRLAILYHYINDILVNREVDRRFPAHWETREYLYKVKLLPRVDYTKAPRHIQFITAILRERIISDERLDLAEEVREAVEHLKDIDGEATDLIDIVSDPSLLPGERFDLIEEYIEPIYEGLFQKDLEERMKAKKEKKAIDTQAIKGETIEGGPRGISRVFEEEYFKEEYDEIEANLPEPLTPDKAREEIEREIRQRKEEVKTSNDMARLQFASLHGVSPEDVEDYADEYKKIEYNIEPLRMVFERMISTRKSTRRRLKERTDHGVIIDPSLIAQAYIDAEAGILDSRTQLKIKKEELDESPLKEFEFTLVCDLSGSMNENWPGGKSYEQRLSAILIVEAMDEFERRLKEERSDSSMDLKMLTEVRGFSSEDAELKPLSDSIDFKTRVAIMKTLESCSGSNTADYKSLAQVIASIDEKTERKIAKGELKKVLLLITDGGSDDVSLAFEAKNRLISKGVITKAIQIGQPNPKDIERFRYVWQEDGLPCKNVSMLVPTIERLLEGLLNELHPEG